MKQYIVIDIGTSSLRAALIGENLRILNIEAIKRTAEAVFDAEEEWENIFRLIKRITDKEKKIDGIAVSSLLSWVGMDAEGYAVTPCYTYMHQCMEEYEGFHNLYTDREIYAVCRRRMSGENAVFKMMRLKNRKKEVYERLACFTSLKDFINAKLTGIMGIDHTFACYTLLYDVEKACWSRELIEKSGIDENKLPVLRRPYEMLGKIKKEIAEELGIESIVPVAVGSVDGSTGILGAGASKAGMAVSVMGTTDVFFMVHKNLCDDASMGLVTNPHVCPGFWISGGPMGIYGGAADWFIQKIMGGHWDIGKMNELAGGIPAGSGGVVAFPTLSGERTPFWNPLLRGTVLGMGMEHGPGHLFRAILEADGYAVRKIAETGKACGIAFDQVIALGGGSKSPLWLQMKADIMRTVHYKSSVEEATITGSCILLLLAGGAKPEEIPPVPVEEEFPVQEKEAEAYDAFYRQYMEIHDKVADIYANMKM